MTPDYSRADVVRALREIGLVQGDVVFTHSSVGMLGVPAEGLDRGTIASLFLESVQEVIGAEGTWVLPTYTYSYTQRKPFDPTATPPPASMGLLPQELWRKPEAHRTLDPLFSVIALGGGASELVASAGATDCFGEASLYARLLERDAVLCNIGIGVHSALIHYVEQKLKVPYRYPKVFSGSTVVAGQRRETEVVYNVRALDRPRDVPYFMRLDADARSTGSAKVARVGRGEINAIRARRVEELIRAGLERDPEYLVLGDLAGRPVG